MELASDVFMLKKLDRFLQNNKMPRTSVTFNGFQGATIGTRVPTCLLGQKIACGPVKKQDCGVLERLSANNEKVATSVAYSDVLRPGPTFHEM